MIRKLTLAVLLSLTGSLALGQSYLIRNARIVPVSGPEIERGNIAIVDGRIQAVGASAKAPRGATRINARGLTVYPGLFNADTRVGLTEVGAVEVTNDSNEMGDYTPQLLAWTAIHVESEHIPVARVDGITHVVTRPAGGTIPGQGAIVHLDGWSQEEMEIERRGALYVTLPELLRVRAPRFGGTAPTVSYSQARNRYDETVAHLKELFAQVRHHAQLDPSRRQRNRQLDALIPAAEGGQLVVLQANSQADIKAAVELARELSLNYAVLGASEAWKIPEFLRENQVQILLGPLQTLPGRPDDPINSVYEAPRILHQHGVRFAVTTGGSANARTLPFEVGNAVAHGLPADAALRSVTLAPAEIFGVDKQVGSIEPGKLANLVVTTGDIFEYQTEIRHVFIKGRPVSLESKHTRLYEKYLNRPLK